MRDRSDLMTVAKCVVRENAELKGREQGEDPVSRKEGLNGPIENE